MPDVGASGAQYQPDPFRAIVGDYGAVRVAWERENLTALWVPKIFDSQGSFVSLSSLGAGLTDLANFFTELPLELRTPYRSVILAQGSAQVRANTQDPNSPSIPSVTIKTQIRTPSGTDIAGHTQISSIGPAAANLSWDMSVGLGASAIVEEGVYQVTLFASRINATGLINNILLNAWVFPFQK